MFPLKLQCMYVVRAFPKKELYYNHEYDYINNIFRNSMKENYLVRCFILKTMERNGMNGIFQNVLYCTLHMKQFRLKCTENGTFYIKSYYNVKNGLYCLKDEVSFEPLFYSSCHSYFLVIGYENQVSNNTI